MGFVDLVLQAMGDFFRAPFREPALLWQLIPVLIIWILMEWYFGLYKNEQLGWNSAVGNGVSLFWIGVTSMQHVFANPFLMTVQRVTVLSLIIGYSIFVIYVSFRHRIRAKLAFFIASPTPIYFSSFLVLLYAFDTLSFSVYMFVAILVIFGALLVVDKIVRTLIPEASNDEPNSDGGDFGSGADTFADTTPANPIPDINPEPGTQAGMDYGTASNPTTTSDPFSKPL